MSPYATADVDALLAAIRAELPSLRRMGVLRQRDQEIGGHEALSRKPVDRAQSAL
jgi:hypothetical protein